MLAARQLSFLSGSAVVASSGTLMALVGAQSTPSLAAALFYLPHSTLVAALLLVLTDCIRQSRGSARDSLRHIQIGASRWTLAWLFLAAAMLQAGLPPLSGFLSKLLMLQSLPVGVGWWVLLGAGLLTLIALIIAGIHLFWRSPGGAPAIEGELPSGQLLVPRMLVVLLFGYSIAAGPISAYGSAAAQQLRAPQLYMQAVLQVDPRVKNFPSVQVLTEPQP
jgi:multicomponent K+:H+ antiporter subunit D